MNSVDDLVAVESGERDRCLRRVVCILSVDLACIFLAPELMKGAGLAGWLEGLDKDDGDRFG